MVIAAVAAATVVAGLGVLVGDLAEPSGTGSSAGSDGPGVSGGVAIEEVDRLFVRGRLPDAVPPGPPAVVPASAGPAVEVMSPITTPGADAPVSAGLPASPAVGAIGSSESSEETEPELPAAGTAEVRRSRVRRADREAPAATGQLDSLAVRRVVGGERRSLEACYWTARSEYPALAGDATFVVTVKPEGAVEVDVDRTSAELDQSGVTSCIKSRLESLDFQRTPPRGGDVRLRVPMSFEDPRGPEDAAEETR